MTSTDVSWLTILQLFHPKNRIGSPKLFPPLLRCECHIFSGQILFSCLHDSRFIFPVNFGYLNQQDTVLAIETIATRKFGGWGLGLTPVRHLVELHGITVSVFSDGPGLRATFTVKLPLTHKDFLLLKGGWGYEIA
jgi:hypothetical protein